MLGAGLIDGLAMFRACWLSTWGGNALSRSSTADCRHRSSAAGLSPVPTGGRSDLRAVSLRCRARQITCHAHGTPVFHLLLASVVIGSDVSAALYDVVHNFSASKVRPRPHSIVGNGSTHGSFCPRPRHAASDQTTMHRAAHLHHRSRVWLVAPCGTPYYGRRS